MQRVSGSGSYAFRVQGLRVLVSTGKVDQLRRELYLEELRHHLLQFSIQDLRDWGLV